MHAFFWHRIRIIGLEIVLTSFLVNGHKTFIHNIFDNYNCWRYFHTDNVAMRWESYKWIRDLANLLVVAWLFRMSIELVETKQKQHLSGFDRKYNFNALTVLWSIGQANGKSPKENCTKKKEEKMEGEKYCQSHTKRKLFKCTKRFSTLTVSNERANDVK